MHISITPNTVENIEKWFTSYVDTFKNNDPEIQENLNLKKDHTFRVCKEILNIGTQLGLNDDELRLAKIIALLHDVGRFEQYTRYQTFKDAVSTNHAELGVRILEKNGIFALFDTAVQDIIRMSIIYHNRPTLPVKETNISLFYPKLIRDADKLDIWNVVTDYYSGNNGVKNRALELDLPISPGFSEKVIEDLINRHPVNIHHVKNLNDLKLMQIGWVFDINFKPTMDCIKKRCYLEMIRDTLPESKEIDQILHIANSLQNKDNGG